MSDTDAANETRQTSAADRTTQQSSASPGSAALRGWDAVNEHISTHKIDFVLAVTRFLTLLCTLSYLLGFPGPSSNRFKQALLMNAATSSLRLHQRMPPPPLNQLGRPYFYNLIREDSFHYLIFPLMFFTGYPIALALLPCCLYAIFNLAVFSITILDKYGNQDRYKAKISDLVAKYQQSLLHTIALSEIALMPLVVCGAFTQFVGILVPVLYYRFLMLRYNSTRNAHMKMLVSKIVAFANNQASRYLRR